MELFKAVEKEMKTKAFSKEGLSQHIKQDPKEKERDELCDFLTEQLEEINRFLTEELEPEAGTLQAGMKKKQKDTSKADRLAEIENITDTFKWHESRLQLLLRSLQNGNVDNQNVIDIKSEIEEVVREGRDPDFDKDAYEGIYDECNLDNEEAQFGLNMDMDRISSQDTQSIQDEPEPESQPPSEPQPQSQPPAPKKIKSDPPPVRRPSTQLKSPLPALATLNNVQPVPSIPKDTTMKPAPLPTRPPGEVLKYVSVAAAAAAGDKNGVGIAPLPPPPGSSTAHSNPPSVTTPFRGSAAASPVSVAAHPVEKTASPAPPAVDESTQVEHSAQASKSPTLSSTSAPATSRPSTVPPTPAMDNVEVDAGPVIADDVPVTNGESVHEDPNSVESIYHLPPGLQEMLDSYETVKNRPPLPASQMARMLQASQDSCPEPADLDRPQHYRPTYKYATPAHYPQDILPIFDDPALYENQRMETDTLFYIFYYRQGTYQQYLAARALKNQSWRFHKQYQTWFQRHEEPKAITEEYEQGTYRFFDYESTW